MNTHVNNGKLLQLTIHGVNSLKGHYLRLGGVSLLEHLSEMSHIIVAENKLLSTAVPDALDHWGMVACIRIDLTTWYCAGEMAGENMPNVCIKRKKEKGTDFFFCLLCLPGSILARVKRVESLATKQEVKRSAASFLCRSANSCSSSTWNLLVPEIFLVPPAPEPCLCKVSLETERMHTTKRLFKSYLIFWGSTVKMECTCSLDTCFKTKVNCALKR